MDELEFSNQLSRTIFFSLRRTCFPIQGDEAHKAIMWRDGLVEHSGVTTRGGSGPTTNRRRGTVVVVVECRTCRECLEPDFPFPRCDESEDGTGPSGVTVPLK